MKECLENRVWRRGGCSCQTCLSVQRCESRVGWFLRNKQRKCFLDVTHSQKPIRGTISVEKSMNACGQKNQWMLFPQSLGILVKLWSNEMIKESRQNVIFLLYFWFNFLKCCPDGFLNSSLTIHVWKFLQSSCNLMEKFCFLWLICVFSFLKLMRKIILKNQNCSKPMT